MLGESAGRKPLVVSFATDDSDGRNWTARSVPTIQAATTRKRKRTTKAPRLEKKRLMRSLSWTSGCDGASGHRRRPGTTGPGGSDRSRGGRWAPWELAPGGQQHGDDPDGGPDGETGQADPRCPAPIPGPRRRVDDRGGLAERAEVEDPSRSEPGAEPEPRLEVARRRCGCRQDEHETSDRVGMQDEECRECAVRHQRADVPGSTAPGDLLRTDVADARLIPVEASAGCRGWCGESCHCHVGPHLCRDHSR